MSKRRKRPLHIVLASTKGGASKTTLSAALAVRAVEAGGKVALVDKDPQASLARWHELRGSPPNPKIVDVDHSSEALGLAMAQKWDHFIIDTPPALLDHIEHAIHMADVVVVPVRPSALDLEAVVDVVTLCKAYDKPFGFVITQVPDKGFARMVQGARKYLERLGHVFETQISFRKAYISAMTLGKSGPETGDTTAKAEIDALWEEMQALAVAPHE